VARSAKPSASRTSETPRFVSRLHYSGIDLNGPGGAVSMVIWVLRESGGI